LISITKKEKADLEEIFLVLSDKKRRFEKLQKAKILFFRVMVWQKRL
jgi:hypothetical protein